MADVAQVEALMARLVPRAGYVSAVRSGGSWMVMLRIGTVQHDVAITDDQVTSPDVWPEIVGHLL